MEHQPIKSKPRGASVRVVHAFIPAATDNNGFHFAKCLLWTVVFLAVVLAAVLAGSR